jgi:hypothetical protein
MQIPGALPNFLKVWWICASPFAVLFAARILWEKTIWAWSRGPQTVGFARWHIHPGFALVGTLCSLAGVLWLLITVPYAIARRRDIGPWDWLMMTCSVLVIVALALPEHFLCIVGETVRRERRWTSAGATPARELVRSTR